MSWIPTPYLLEGELDNTQPGKITGWLQFAGMKNKAVINLEGDFCSDIQGKKIVLSGRFLGREAEAARYMEGFTEDQTGHAGKITAGMPPAEYTDFPYIEWESEHNGRVVMYVEPHQIDVIHEAA